MAGKRRVKANPFQPHEGSFGDVPGLFLLLNEKGHAEKKPRGFMEMCVGSGAHRAVETYIGGAQTIVRAVTRVCVAPQVIIHACKPVVMTYDLGG